MTEKHEIAEIDEDDLAQEVETTGPLAAQIRDIYICARTPADNEPIMPAQYLTDLGLTRLNFIFGETLKGLKHKFTCDEIIKLLNTNPNVEGWEKMAYHRDINLYRHYDLVDRFRNYGDTIDAAIPKLEESLFNWLTIEFVEKLQGLTLVERICMVDFCERFWRASKRITDSESNSDLAELLSKLGLEVLP